MSTLKLTLKKQWFDMISRGIKKEEYRQIKPYFQVRLENKEYDRVIFINGYNRNSPRVTLEYLGYRIGEGKKEWGAIENEKYYIIMLGEIVNEL